MLSKKLIKLQKWQTSVALEIKKYQLHHIFLRFKLQINNFDEFLHLQYQL